MRILNTKQIRELDAFTIKQEGIQSVDLMERAARAFVDWFTIRVEATKKLGIVCGTGNNGGDGLAIARMLHEWRYEVKVWIVSGGAAESEDFKTNLKLLPEKVPCKEIDIESDLISFEDCDVLIDAIFGSGLSRPAEGLYAKVIEHFNGSEALKMAVDIPSGLMADTKSAGSIVRAHYTVSFQLPKLAFFLPECYQFTGEWFLVDIGLNKDFIKVTDASHHYVLTKDVRRMLRPRNKYDHKGTFGHALLIAGSFGKMGAAILASKAALRSGLGLLTIHIPACGYEIIQTAVPEAMAQADQHPRVFSAIADLQHYSALGIGPGIGRAVETVDGLGKILEIFQKPVVMDADALNILADNRHLLSVVPPGSILTPHPKEFERLVGKWSDDFERLEKQKELAFSLKSVIVLKGAHTSVCTENGDIYFNSTGNPGMATGGTGDVLTGIITGLLTQGYSSKEAAILGVFLHGMAGDLALQERGTDSLIASDLIDYLPGAFLKITRK